MNRPSRTDEPLEGDGYNQSPRSLSNNLTANQDLKRIANARELRRDDSKSSHDASSPGDSDGVGVDGSNTKSTDDEKSALPLATIGTDIGQPLGDGALGVDASVPLPSHSPPLDGSNDQGQSRPTPAERLMNFIFKFFSFIGPGFMIAVAYSKSSFKIKKPYISHGR